MAFVNLKKKEVQVKIVYYGPGRGGKTTNLEFIYNKFNDRMYTVPGQVKYNATRRLVLRGVDGVVFVADSMKVRRKSNMLSVKNLQ